jgi:hypothetical protein
MTEYKYIVLLISLQQRLDSDYLQSYMNALARRPIYSCRLVQGRKGTGEFNVYLYSRTPYNVPVKISKSTRVLLRVYS